MCVDLFSGFLQGFLVGVLYGVLGSIDVLGVLGIKSLGPSGLGALGLSRAWNLNSKSSTVAASIRLCNTSRPADLQCRMPEASLRRFYRSPRRTVQGPRHPSVNQELLINVNLPDFNKPSLEGLSFRVRSEGSGCTNQSLTSFASRPAQRAYLPGLWSTIL